MSKWTAEGNIIHDDDGSQIAEVCCCAIDNDLARQIVREHNAHAELVSLLEGMLKNVCDDCMGERPGRCLANKELCALSSQARAAIEASEGR